MNVLVSRPVLVLLSGLAPLLLFDVARAEDPAEPIYAAVSVTPYPSAKSGGNYLHNYYLPPAGNSSPWWASWSADGSELYFALHGSLWKIGAAGGRATAIKQSDEYLSSPTLSPDGRSLAYAAETHGRSINLRILN